MAKKTENIVENCSVIRLDLSNQADFDTKCKCINRFSLDDVKKIGYFLPSLMKKYRFECMDRDGKFIVPSSFKAFDSQVQKKSDWVGALAVFLLPCNLKTFISILPDNLKSLLLETAKRHYITEQSAKKIYGEQCLAEVYWLRKDVIVEISLFFQTISLWNASFKPCYYMELLGADMYRCCLEYLFEKERELVFADSIPDNIQIFNGEDCILNDFMQLEPMFDGGRISAPKTKLITMQLMRNVEDVHFKEFFHDDQSDWLFSHLRSFYVFNLYAEMKKAKAYSLKDDMAFEIIRKMFGNLHLCDEMLFKTILPHIEGLKKKNIQMSSYSSLLLNVKKCLDYLEEKRWMSVGCFLLKVRTNGHSADNVSPERVYRLFNVEEYSKCDVKNDYTDKKIPLERIVADISDPFVKSCLFLFAAFGLVEIAFSNNRVKDETSIYDRLQYVRLTRLGSYVIGRTSTYSMIAADKDELPDFILDEERLLIKITKPRSPYFFVIDKFASAVTQNLYRVDPKSFLKTCSGKTDVQEKITLFKRYFGNNIPKVWTDFFESLLSQCNPLKKVKGKYELRQISPADKRLQEIILSDENLRKLVLRTEKYMLIIKSDDVEKVGMILKSYGYIL